MMGGESVEQAAPLYAKIRCVACKHVEWIPMPADQPFCSLCLSPSIVIAVSSAKP